MIDEQEINRVLAHRKRDLNCDLLAFRLRSEESYEDEDGVEKIIPRHNQFVMRRGGTVSSVVCADQLLERAPLGLVIDVVCSDLSHELNRLEAPRTSSPRGG
jgi:hypothetical protein